MHRNKTRNERTAVTAANAAKKPARQKYSNYRLAKRGKMSARKLYSVLRMFCWKVAGGSWGFASRFHIIAAITWKNAQSGWSRSDRLYGKKTAEYDHDHPNNALFRAIGRLYENQRAFEILRNDGEINVIGWIGQNNRAARATSTSIYFFEVVSC